MKSRRPTKPRDLVPIQFERRNLGDTGGVELLYAAPRHTVALRLSNLALYLLPMTIFAGLLVYVVWTIANLPVALGVV